MDTIPVVAPTQAAEFEARLNAVLRDLDKLPTLPQILWEIMAQLQDSENAAADLASAIEDDPSLTANVLRLANSAFYGFSERFVSIRDAVVAIGRREIERMISATLVIDTFGVRDPQGWMDYRQFWIHCLEAAETSEFISTVFHRVSPYAPSEAYLGGLLHDIGKLVLNQMLPAQWRRAHACAEEYKCSDAEAERAVLGLDHGEIGARLMETWGLQSNLVLGTRGHHRLSDSTRAQSLQAEIIGFVDSLCHSHEQDRLPKRGISHRQFELDEQQTAMLIRTLNNARKRASVLLA